MAYYIITEDDKDRAGYQFYSLLNKYYCNDRYKVLSAKELVSNSSSGQSVLVDALSNNKFNKGDVVIVAFDNQLNAFREFSNEEEYKYIQGIYMQIDLKISLLKMHGVRCRLLNYICFEEVMLYSNFILKSGVISSNSTNKWVIMLNDFLSLKKKQPIDYKSFLLKYNYRNMEHALKALLSSLSRMVVKGQFTIDSSGFKACWFKDCKDMLNNKPPCYTYKNGKLCVIAEKQGVFCKSRNQYLLYGEDLFSQVVNIMIEELINDEVTL